jgi:mannan endo-1,4-beta-mannosidase
MPVQCRTSWAVVAIPVPIHRPRHRPRLVSGALVIAVTGAAAFAGLARLPSPPPPRTPNLTLAVGAALKLPVDWDQVAATLDPPGQVRRHGPLLYLDGSAYRFVGINAPQAASDYAVAPGCGAPIDLPELFAQLPANSIVRVGFSQDLALDARTGTLDWAGLDRVVQAAAASPNHVRLAVSLTSQSGTCDGGHWRTASWYAGGFRQPSTGTDGRSREAFATYLAQVVQRYAPSPAIAYWEPAGEPEASNCPPGLDGTACYGHQICPADATAILRSFFDQVGSIIRQYDPIHPIADGAIGTEQCGWAGDGTATILASPGIDIATYHDYGDDGTAVPAGLRQLAAIAAAAGKPLVVDEAGIDARDIAGCTSLSTRAAEFEAKFEGARSVGVVGYLPWDYSAGGDGTCDTRIQPPDPLLSVFQQEAATPGWG